MLQKYIVFTSRPIYGLNHVSIKRKGIIGIIHFHIRHMRLVKETGVWTQEERLRAREIAIECRNESFPKLRKYT